MQTRAVFSYYRVDCGVPRQDAGRRLVWHRPSPNSCLHFYDVIGEWVSASKFHRLIEKRFSVQITASMIWQFLRMTFHWITVRAKTGLQHWWDCASHLCDSFLSLHKLSSICQLCNVVEQRWRAKLVQHDQSTVPSKKNWLHTFK